MEFFKSHIFTRQRIFSASSDCQSPLLHHGLWSFGDAYTAKGKVARERSWAPHSWTLQCSSLQLWFALCLQEQFAPTTPNFLGKGHQIDEVATELVQVVLNSRL